MDLLTFTKSGIYCPQADVFIDPWKPVKKALVTHGHSDHARPGHKAYLCTHDARPVIEHRLGPINIESVAYREEVIINNVKFSFHPAGHIIGSAQVRVAYQGEVWVVSGDYKITDDGISGKFESIKCDVFITESTFGLPVYRWKDQSEVYDSINQWWQENKDEGKVTILTGYSLGKAQRLIHSIDHSIGPIFTHGAIENINEIIRAQRFHLPETIYVNPDQDNKNYKGGIVICPPSATDTNWMKRFHPYSIGIASGWMALRGPRRRRSVDRGFALSDHADWDGLNTAIKESGARKVYVTHGYTSIFSKWLNENGIDSEVVKTKFEGELGEIGEGVS